MRKRIQIQLHLQPAKWYTFQPYTWYIIKPLLTPIKSHALYKTGSTKINVFFYILRIIILRFFQEAALLSFAMEFLYYFAVENLYYFPAESLYYFMRNNHYIKGFNSDPHHSEIFATFFKKLRLFDF